MSDNGQGAHGRPKGLSVIEQRINEELAELADRELLASVDAIIDGLESALICRWCGHLRETTIGPCRCCGKNRHTEAK